MIIGTFMVAHFKFNVASSNALFTISFESKPFSLANLCMRSNSSCAVSEDTIFERISGTRYPILWKISNSFRLENYLI